MFTVTSLGRYVRFVRQHSNNSKQITKIRNNLMTWLHLKLCIITFLKHNLDTLRIFERVLRGVFHDMTYIVMSHYVTNSNQTAVILSNYVHSEKLCQ